MNTMKDKMSDKNKLEICLEAKKVYYLNCKGKDYSKNTIHKLKSQIKGQLEKKSLDWETQKNLMYWIDDTGIENMTNVSKLKHDHMIELKKKETEINLLKQELFGTKECYKAQRINMRDTIKKEYEQTFKDKYSTTSIKELEDENNKLKTQLWEIRTSNNKEINELNERWEKKLSEIREEHFKTLTKNNSPESTPKSKCKKCKRLKRENLKLQLKLSQMDSSSSDSESDENISMVISSPHSSSSASLSS